MDSPALSKIRQQLIELDKEIGLRLDEVDKIVRRRATPFLAIMQADLKSIMKTRITYGWLIAAAFVHVLFVLGAVAYLDTSSIIVQVLSDFTMIWIFLVIAISASAVSTESGEIADSIMSKSVRRYDYILAKFASRISYVLVIYSALTTVVVGISLRAAENTHDVSGLVATILFVALLLIMVTSLGVTISTLAPSTIISIISMLILWTSMLILLPALDVGLLAPTELLITLQDVIQGVWTGEEWIPATVYSTITILSIITSAVYFSLKDL
ncbi:MAG: ABC transporter permease [Candidatus Thorarchaeota archaeon]